jgi:hypothetical protein
LGRFRRLLKERKPLIDAGLEVVPRDGIEPPTRGFSVRLGQTGIWCNRLIYKHVSFSPTLDFVGLLGIIFGRRGQSHGQSRGAGLKRFQQCSQGHD